MGEGTVRRADGSLVDAATALAEAGLTPVELAAKEGLALINGTDGMLGMLVLALTDLRNLLAVADVAAAMSVEAQLATDRVFAEDLQALRPHPGQAASVLGEEVRGGENGQQRGEDRHRSQADILEHLKLLLKGKTCHEHRAADGTKSEQEDDVKDLLTDEFGESIPGDGRHLDAHHRPYVRTCSLSRRDAGRNSVPTSSPLNAAGIWPALRPSTMKVVIPCDNAKSTA